MFAVNAYTFRRATDRDTQTLRELAQLDDKSKLTGEVLIGEIAGRTAAAIAVSDDRVIADPFVPSTALVQQLRMRSYALRALARRPSLRERMIAGARVRTAQPASH